jgi:hypothetical protein
MSGNRPSVSIFFLISGGDPKSLVKICTLMGTDNNNKNK